MPGPKPGMRPRPMGGFNPGMGAANEHLDEASFKAAGAQKQLSQQQSSTQTASGKSGTNPLVPQADSQVPTGEDQGAFQPEKPREVAGFKKELIDRPLQDIKTGLASFVDLNTLFNVNTEDSPEEQANKKSLHQRFGKLTQEQQQVAQKNYQKKMEEKKLEQEEEEQKKQEEAQKEQASIAPPSSPKKGPIGPASGMSKKEKTGEMLQQSRQGLSRAGKKY
jgi:hypothetical protein